jgi:hypothetical protein
VLSSRDSEPGPTCDPRPITEAGPAGMYCSYGWCPCGWRGPSRVTRAEAEADATNHGAEAGH